MMRTFFLLMLVMLTFRERKRIVTILKTSHGVEGTILACQVVGARFLQMQMILLQEATLW